MKRGNPASLERCLVVRLERSENLSKTRNPHQAKLTADEARRAIHIDFEKNEKLAPTVLGILWEDRGSGECHFEQHVVEDCFFSAAEAKGLAKGVNCFCVISSLEGALQRVLELARANDGPVVAWSEFDIGVIREYASDDLSDEVAALYRSALATAKPYKQRCFQDYELPKPKGFRPGGRHSLFNYLNMIGYPIPHMGHPGQVGPPLSQVRDMLLRYDCDHGALTPRKKGIWTNILDHNRADCCGMREIMLRATEGYRSEEPEPCGPCTVVGSEPVCPG